MVVNLFKTLKNTWGKNPLPSSETKGLPSSETKGEPPVTPPAPPLMSIENQITPSPPDSSPTLSQTIPQWQLDYQALPWLDQPDAHQQLEAKYKTGTLCDQHYHWLKQWIDHGYFVVDDLFSPDLLDTMIQDLDQLWYVPEPVPSLTVYHLGPNREDCRDYTHAEVLALPVAVREQMRDHSNWRIHGVHEITEGARAIFQTPALSELASLILGQPCGPKYSISFQGGSQQRLHEDMSVFHIVPLNHIIGIWVAAEDISPDSGPLVIYPGSHRATLYEKFTNYPQTNVRTAGAESKQAYFDWVKKRAENYPRKEFLAKKGQVLFWHGMLIHGGSEIKNPNLTRRSFVMHCIPDGCDRATEVYGPFNW